MLLIKIQNFIIFDYKFTNLDGGLTAVMVISDFFLKCKFKLFLILIFPNPSPYMRKNFLTQ